MHASAEHEEVKFAVGGPLVTVVGETNTAGAAQLPVASVSTVLGPVTVVPFHGAWCSLPSTLVAYQREPFATNMPLAVVKSTGLPPETTVVSTGLMTPPVTWLATEEACVSGEKARLKRFLLPEQRVVDRAVRIEHAGHAGQLGVEVRGRTAGRSAREPVVTTLSQ